MNVAIVIPSKVVRVSVTIKYGGEREKIRRRSVVAPKNKGEWTTCDESKLHHLQQHRNRLTTIPVKVYSGGAPSITVSRTVRSKSIASA